MPKHAPLCYRFVALEDYKQFKIVSVLRNGSSVGMTSAYDAAVYMLEKWPDEDGPKARLARQILLNCLAGECSAAVARVAFVEAAKEAGIFVETTPRPPPDRKWGKRKTTLARDRRPPNSHEMQKK